MTATKNPILKLYRGMTVVAGVVGVCSFANDIGFWVYHIDVVLQSYRDLVSAIWGPFERFTAIHIPWMVKNYITVAVIFAGSIVKSGMPAVGDGALMVVVVPLLWPIAAIFLPIEAMVFVIRDRSIKGTLEHIEEEYGYILWVGAVLLGVTILVVANAGFRLAGMGP